MNQSISPLPHSGHPPFLPYNFYEVTHHAEYQEQEQAPAKLTRPLRKAKSTVKSTAKPKPRGRPAIVHVNSIKPYLQSFSSPGHALAKLPQLSDIVTGAVSLNYGNNGKPLGIKTALVLLRRLDEITSEAIEEYMLLSLRECTQRHAQRLAQCLRVIERAAARIAKDKWPAPGEINEADVYRTAHSIVPCSEQGCEVCRETTAVTQAWSLATAEQDATTDISPVVGVDVANEGDWTDLEDPLFNTD
jgi:hypothetical protein